MTPAQTDPLSDADVIAALRDRDAGYHLALTGIGDQAERLRLCRERLAELGPLEDAGDRAHARRDLDLEQTGEGLYRPEPACPDRRARIAAHRDRMRLEDRALDLRAARYAAREVRPARARGSARAPRRSASRARRPACRRSAARAPAGSDGGSDQPGEPEAGEPPGRPTDRCPSGRSRPVAPGIAADHWVTRRRRDPMEGSR